MHEQGQVQFVSNDKSTHHNHPEIFLRLIKDMSMFLCMQTLAWSIRKGSVRITE